MNQEQINRRAEELGIGEDLNEWDRRELGADVKHAKVSSHPTSIRIPDTLIASLKTIAANYNLPYQSYIKMVLSEHVMEKLGQQNRLSGQG